MTVVEETPAKTVPTHRELLERAALVIEEHGFAVRKLFSREDDGIPHPDDPNGVRISIGDAGNTGYCGVGAIWRAAYDHGLLPATWEELYGDGRPTAEGVQGVYEKIVQTAGLDGDDALGIFEINDNFKDPTLVTHLLRQISLTV